MAENLIVFTQVSEDRGWVPIHHMARLAADLMAAPLAKLPARFSPLQGIRALLVGRRRMADKPDVLLIVSGPTNLRFLLSAPGWRTSFHRVAAWIIDSFWTERVARLRLDRVFDHFFVCSGVDVAEYERKTRVSTSFLPWGSDVLGLGGASASRDIDLLRVGRQPDSWSDDESNRAACEALGIRYGSRPPFAEDPSRQQALLMQSGFLRAKLALAHSNFVQQTSYTHPTKEYITGRWTDALACGCVVAGVPPRTDPAFSQCLWPEAILDLGSPERDLRLPAIAEYLQSWSPAIAEHNHQMALRRLDWRWRFREISKWFGRSPARLDAEIATIVRMTGGQPSSREDPRGR